MNVRLQTLLAEAEAVLSDEEQDDLADLISDFMRAPDKAAFTPEEIAHLNRLAAQPFVEADPEEVAAFFGRRG